MQLIISNSSYGLSDQFSVNSLRSAFSFISQKHNYFRNLYNIPLFYEFHSDRLSSGDSYVKVIFDNFSYLGFYFEFYFPVPLENKTTLPRFIEVLRNLASSFGFILMSYTIYPYYVKP